jgi:hypothetical protein
VSKEIKNRNFDVCKIFRDWKEIKNLFFILVAFKIYDIDKDGFISNGELFQVLKMMVGSNLKDSQLQQIVDKVKKELIINERLNFDFIRPLSMQIKMAMEK